MKYNDGISKPYHYCAKAVTVMAVTSTNTGMNENMQLCISSKFSIGLNTAPE